HRRRHRREKPSRHGPYDGRNLRRLQRPPPPRQRSPVALASTPVIRRPHRHPPRRPALQLRRQAPSEEAKRNWHSRTEGLSSLSVEDGEGGVRLPAMVYFPPAPSGAGRATVADASWGLHMADALRRNNIRLFATVPDYIVSQVLDPLWA